MRWSILVVLALQAAMCGQKGPLYLPEEKQNVAAPFVHFSEPATAPAGSAWRR